MSIQRRVNILSVGDASTCTASVRKSLQATDKQYCVQSAGNASDGLDRLAAADFDCVISAYDLPNRTGIEFFGAVRENDHDLPFILCSAESDEMIASEAVSAGVTEYVPNVAHADQSGLLLDRLESATGRACNRSHEYPQFSCRFEAIFETSEQLIGVLDPDGTIRDANQTALEYIDVGRKAVVGTLFSETPWWSTDARPDVRRWVSTAASGERVKYETASVQFGDNTQSVVGEIIPVTDDDGTVSELIVIAQDTAEHSRRERELARTREQLSLALDAADAAVWEMDLETEELYWDDRAQELWGYEPGEFNGTLEEFVEPIHPDDWDRLETAYQTAIEHRTDYTVQIRVSPSDEPVRWVEAAGQVVTDEDDKPRRVIGLSTDVTERKEREQQLQRQNERLEEFTSVVSHDLRNPLNVAQGRAALLHDQCDDESETHSMQLRNALDRMETLINDTLTLAREGEAVGELTAVQIADLAYDCWAHVETGEATLEIEDEVLIQGDGDRLRHVFENLFRNAVEHGDDDTTVRVGRDGEACLYIEDDGPGIPASRRDKAFEPGYTSTSQGTGFGLTIVKRIAEAHGWTVTVTDGRDGGARFEFETAGLGET